MQLPQDVCNRSLDAIGHDVQIGAFTDGTTESEVCRRLYGPTLRQLLRTANWTFARKQASLQLLGDATGQTLDPTGTPYPTTVEQPWIYAYAWPIDGVKARWLPQQLPTAMSVPPPVTNLAVNPGLGWILRPARFLISSSDQFPVVIGQTDWDSLPDLSSTEGVGNTSRRVVLTNVQNAMLVYTKLVLEIEEWDELFTQAMVSIIASWISMRLLKDKKLALTVRAQQIAIAKEAILQARVANGNDAGFPQGVTREASWILARNRGGANWGWGTGWPGAWDTLGSYYYGWETVGLADGSVF